MIFDTEHTIADLLYRVTRYNQPQYSVQLQSLLKSLSLEEQEELFIKSVPVGFKWGICQKLIKAGFADCLLV